MSTIDLDSLCIEWANAGTRTTRRGKVKPVITGIPTPNFWLQYKGKLNLLKDLGLTVERLHKGQWEAIIWLNRHNLATVQGLLDRWNDRRKNDSKPTLTADVYALFGCTETSTSNEPF